MKINLDEIKIGVNTKELAKAFSVAAKKTRNIGTYPKSDEYGEMHENGDLSIKIDLENGETLEIIKIDFTDWEYLTEADKQKIELYLRGGEDERIKI